MVVKSFSRYYCTFILKYGENSIPQVDVHKGQLGMQTQTRNVVLFLTVANFKPNIAEQETVSNDRLPVRLKDRTCIGYDNVIVLVLVSLTFVSLYPIVKV